MIENNIDKTDPFLNGGEMAKQLGISLPTFYRWVKAGLPKAVEAEGAPIYKMSDAKKWILSKKSDPMPSGRLPLYRTLFLKFQTESKS